MQRNDIHMILHMPLFLHLTAEFQKMSAMCPNCSILLQLVFIKHIKLFSVLQMAGNITLLQSTLILNL